MAATTISDFQNVEILAVGRIKMAKMRYRAKFCGDQSSRCCRHLRFLKCSKFGIFKSRKVKRDKMSHHAKFHRNRSNRCWDMTIFRFFKMAAAAVLDFQKMGILGAAVVKRAKMRH